MVGRQRGRAGRGWDAAPPSGGRRGGAKPDAETGAGDGAIPTDRSDPAIADPAEAARRICLQLLAQRPRTRVELASALRRQHVSDAVAAEVLERYSDVGIIDDAAFARAWVRSRHHGRGLAGKALASELRRKGIDSVTVGAALAELDSETERQTARELVERRIRSRRGGLSEPTTRQLIGMLARKGYSPGLAFAVVKQVLVESRSGSCGVAAEGAELEELEGELLGLDLTET